VGKYVLVKGAANSTVTSLVAQIITFVNSNHVVINTNAVTTVTNALVLWATDDTATIQTAIIIILRWYMPLLMEQPQYSSLQAPDISTVLRDH